MLWLFLMGSVFTVYGAPPKVEVNGATQEGRIVWRTDPGRKYEVTESENLKTWTPVQGSPFTSANLGMQHLFTADMRSKFFRVVPVDETPPVIQGQFPHDSGKAIGRFSDITITMVDESGIDSSTISLTIGDSGAMTLAATSALTWDGETLVFTRGADTAWGAYGEVVSASLTVVDTKGNSLVHNWSFRLELEDIVTANVFVFGSPAAQRSGQRVDGPTVTVARTAPNAGPIRMVEASEWSISEVNPDNVIIVYTGVAAPAAFQVAQFLANATPNSSHEIFYRKITALADDPGNKILTLTTVEVGLAVMLDQGSVSLNSSALYFDEIEGGALIPARSVDFTYNLPELGQNADGAELFKNDNVTVSLPLANWSFKPRLEISLDVQNSELEEFRATAIGDFSASLQLQMDVTGSLENEFHTDTPLYTGRKYIFIGWISFVPVWLEVKFELNASAGYLLEADATATTGVTQTMNMGFGVIYKPGQSPETEWIRFANLPDPVVIPFTYTIHGHANIWAQLEPRLDILVNSLAGVYGEIIPRLEVDMDATYSDGSLDHASWLTTLTGDLNAGVSLPLTPSLEAMIPHLNYPLFKKNWGQTYLATLPAEIAITQQPQGSNVEDGSNLELNVMATAPLPISYQWYFNNELIDGETEAVLRIGRISQSYTGEYFVRLTSGEEALDSSKVSVVVRSFNSGASPAGFAMIPAGNFVMGDTFSEGYSNERPTRTVYVSAFYMAKTEVTKVQWDEVAVWAATHGYDITVAGGSGKAADHPVQSVTWYECVKWCNAKSEKERRSPVYTVSGTAYKTGNSTPVINYAADGYRLPTEAEWEKAARGGLSGKRFPWGDTIDHSHANYRANGSAYTYDVSSYTTYTYHLTYNDGSSPYTSPVGSFPANGYGLYDMTGNVWEWCSDWYGSSYYGESGNTSDPAGAASGSYRVLRGGSWSSYARICRVAFRDYDYPDSSYGNLGFRPVSIGSE